MFRLVLALLFPATLPAAELLRDKHANETYIFSSDAADVPGTVEQAQATLIGTRWAMRFYRDAFLTTLSCECRIVPIRYWLLTLARSESGAKVFVVVLPDGEIVEPRMVEGA